MCCFNHPIDHVHSTRIFVGTRNGQQITVYSAALVGSRIEMVLPVRSRGAEKIEFVDMKSYPTFFEDCERASMPVTRAGKVMSAGSRTAAAPGYLPVERVGDYDASFAPSLPDLKRADPRVFRLSPRLEAVFRPHYPPDEFGYVIYKLVHSGTMHPFAYRHAHTEGEPLFVPTRHEHGHDGPPDWDHRIYHQADARLIAATERTTGGRAAGATFESPAVAGKPVPAELDLDQPLQRIVRLDEFPNDDLMLGIRDSSSPTVALGGGAAVAGGLAYARYRKRQSGDRKEPPPSPDTT
jgi:hypothetical protein